MARSIWCGLLSLFSIGVIGALPVACQSGGVGDACTPEDEDSTEFSGFAMNEEYIQSRSFQCTTRICLVNHFQGRVSCPLGQPSEAITDCTGPNGARDDLCDAARGEKCVQTDTPGHFVCHKPGDCQQPEASDASNAGKACCVPGTDTPVAVPVCGQCNPKSNRDAAQAVYCSCRCGVANGAPEEPNFPFCDCPTGFTCSEIRPFINLGIDQELTGKYCIKEGTAYDGLQSSCGAVAGNHEKPCQGIGSASE